MRRARAASTAFIMFLAIGLASCGGGGGGSRSSSNSFVSTPQFAVTTTSLPGATRGQPYSATLSANGGTAPFTWTATSIASGLTVSSAGVLSGTPATGGSSIVGVKVTDSSTPAQTATANITLDIFGFGTSLQTGVGQANLSGFSLGNFVVLGGTTPISWSVASGTLPAGTSVRAFADTHSAFLSGIPSQAGTFTFVLRAQDGSTPARVDNLSVQLVISPGELKVTTTALPHATVNQAYSQQVTATGGVPPYTWSLDVFSDKLPAGLTLNSFTGLISGKPTVATDAALIFDLTDGTRFVSQRLSLYVAPSPLPARNDSLATATPIFPGSYMASISPYSDGTAPDTDYYKMSADAGSTWHIAVTGLDKNRANTGAHTIALDAVVEIVDAGGARLGTCNDPADDNPPSGVPITKDPTPVGYDDPCINNGTDFTKAKTAYVDFKVPGSGLVDFYIHVFDWRGYARPDMFYRLDISVKP